MNELVSNAQNVKTVEIQKQCVSWMTPLNVCRTVGKYAVIIFNGDIFTMHLVQAIMMIWTSDLRYGGYPRIPEVSQKVYSHCGCDGQFSSSPICAKFNKVHLSFHDVRTRGLCGGLVYFTSPDFIYTETHPKLHEQYHTMNLSSSLQHLCSPDRRLRFIYLQTGLHRYGNASNVLNVFLKPRLRMIQDIADECKHYIKDLLRIVFMDETSPFSIEDYHYANETSFSKLNQGYAPPLKSRAKLNNHYRSMTSLMSAYPDIYMVNFRAFIAASNISSTYDGLSSLTDVNILKGLYILHLMNKIQEEYKAQMDEKRRKTGGKYK